MLEFHNILEPSPPAGEEEVPTGSSTAAISSLPDPTGDGLSLYLKRIQKYHMLEAEEEYELAKQWCAKKDPQAVKKLITSHLRLVAKIASGYRGYGLPLADVIAEGNLGLMQALKKFDPTKGYRFSTYAMWWIRAAMQEYILRSWSMVKIGTTGNQKKLFFNLRNLKNKLHQMEGKSGPLSQEDIRQISNELAVHEHEVIEMDQRMSGGDLSLNNTVNNDDGNSSEWQDWLEDGAEPMENRILDQQEHVQHIQLLQTSFSILTTREVSIIKSRRLSDPPLTLEELAVKYKISRERVRQLEVKAFEKLRHAFRKHARR
jgi:RNA polymerase sigma-32 factor